MNKLLIFNCAVMLLINVVFFILYERTKPKPEEILPMVVIVCAASLGRVIFAIIPQVQPVTALVIVMGSVYGGKRGYVTGALCALVSNMFLGQGPWTLFQMTGWGIVGFIAGEIGKVTSKLSERKRTLIFTVYAFLSAYLYSFITDFSTICYLGDSLSIASVIAVYMAGFAFAIGHAVFNSIFTAGFFGLLERKLKRIKENV